MRKLLQPSLLLVALLVAAPARSHATPLEVAGGGLAADASACTATACALGEDALYGPLFPAPVSRRVEAAPQPGAPPCWDPAQVTRLPFGLRDTDEPHLRHFLDLYCGPSRRLAASWLARAGRYRAFIEERIAALGAPPELLWVVAIESSFEPTARSPVGATGLWQFMRRTALSRGLRIDRWVDERRCPERSTDEAIAYLQEHHERFGNWLLALAAYNAGYGHVRGQLRVHNLTDFWQLHRYGAIHTGARAYALRTAAIAIIAMNPHAFGMEGIGEERPLTWVRVEVPAATRLTLVASAANTSLQELRTLNPELLQPQTPPGPEPWSLRIPPDALDPFVASWDRVRQRFGGEHERIAIRFGESLESFSARVGIPERILRQINALSHDQRVPPGTEIIVPLRGRSPSSTADTALPEVVILPPQRFAYPDRERIFFAPYTGDNVWQIAAHFDVLPEELAMWNDLDPSAPLWEGMVLQIWVRRLPNPESTRFFQDDEVRALRLGSPEHEAWVAQRARERQVRRRTYEVRPGDTVLGIAIQHGVRASDIIRWNNLREDGRIVVGQELRVRP